MKPVRKPPEGDANEEILALIATLHATGRRLEELTAGEVDSVADHLGRSFVLQGAQERLRQLEAAKQAAILNALPASIAMLEPAGIIVAANEAWRRFAGANVLHAPGHALGVNYLGVCDGSPGDDSAESCSAAAGIRSVLAGAASSFSLEYPCHSAGEKRWFLLTVTPLSDEHRSGAVVMHIDITQRKQAEESLQELQTELRVLLDMVPAMIWLKDTQNRILRVNTPVAKAAGMSVADIEGRPSVEIYPEDAAKYYADDLEVIRSGKPKLAIVESLHGADGEHLWVQTDKVPVLDKDGKVVGVFVMAQDITARKDAENNLRESEARFRSLTGLSSDWYWVQDKEYRFTDFTGGEREAGWGNDQNEALGLCRWDLVGVEPVSGSWDVHKAALAARQPFRNFEYQRTLEDGTVKYVAASGEPVFDADGGFGGYRGVATDITKRKLGERDLQRFRSAMEVSGDAIVLLDRASLKYIDVNQTLCDMVGRTREELIGMTVMELFAISREVLERDYDALIADSSKTSAAGKTEGYYRHKDGSLIPIETRRRAMLTDDGWIIVATARDITERKHAQDRILYLNRVYSVLSGINTLIVRVHDRDELFRESCRIAVEAGGFRMAVAWVLDESATKLVLIASAGMEDELLGSLKDLFSSDQGGLSGATVAAQAIRLKKPLVTKDLPTNPAVVLGTKYAEIGVSSMVNLPLIVADEAVGVLALFAGENEFFHEEEMALLTGLAGDIAFAIDHIGKQDRLNYLAYYDELTGLANRSLFLERVAQYVRSAADAGHKLAVFLMDLERFKNINDSLGQPAGDALLRQVAEWLTRTVGDASLIARLGSDHFAIVLPEILPQGDVARLLERTVSAFLDHPFRLNDAVFRIAAKAGVALFPEDGADADTLLKNAEAALKKAKASGDRYLLFTQTMTASVAGQLTMENQLRQALEREEFVLHYQPKIDLASNQLSGAEALIRWNDPRTGLVPPGRFIPILEETGLIYEVGRWAMRKAIEDYLRWRAAGLSAVRIAVNVSPLQLRNRGFVAEVEQAIGVDAHAAAGLELEITESVIMEDIKHNIASLQAFRAMGLSIAIDDFGTGFSSLSYLAKLPLDILKIDRTFVIDMTASPEGLALVSTIINLAHSLKLKVVAEGVETEEQSRLLRLLNCDQMQGFLFSKPVPAEVFAAKFLAEPAIA